MQVIGMVVLCSNFQIVKKGMKKEQDVLKITCYFNNMTTSSGKFMQEK